MLNDQICERWLDLFPALQFMDAEHLALAKQKALFPTLKLGEIAYQQGWDCSNYVMCLEGQTRVYRTSSSGREVLIYRVSSGGTCVLTTQCLLSGSTFPAESVAESSVRLAALPAQTFRHLMDESAVFRDFVLNDYARLLGNVLSLIEEVTFRQLDQRLAARLLAEADASGMVHKTHQQLALDLGSVREVVSRHLGIWERAGLIATGRGSIEIKDRMALARHRDMAS